MPQPKPALEEWLSPAEAAALLGVKERQLQERAKAGYIQKRYLPRALHERTARVQFSRADIEAIKAGKPNVHARLVVEAAQRPAPESNDHSDVVGEMAPMAPQTALATGETVHQTALARIEIGDAEISVWAHRTAALVAALRASQEPVPQPKPWLTLAEAAEYSGLPKSFLLAHAEQGKWNAVNVGRRKGGAWRFSRDLL